MEGYRESLVLGLLALHRLQGHGEAREMEYGSDNEQVRRCIVGISY